MAANGLIERQARMLAEDNRKAEPEISKIYWFPHPKEVRLIELTNLIPAAEEGRVYPFHFQPSPQDDLPAPSGIALIRPEEFGTLKLPDDWGDWSQAVEV